ncbi:MAG: lipase family protein [Gordonia sp. (in: high G+C Gram-positive bacteria)]|uniref:lipase family protein n=1 Tax=Gordonia sp. (in: high G+C Gram-positive bacteria) TaxID=84139 RepID=UPI0039E39F39
MHCRAFRIVVGAVLAVVLLGTVPGTGHAEPTPPNLKPIPEEIIRGLDDVIPAPAIPKLTRIPQRSRAPGYDHATLELRDAVLPDPIGDAMFDHWPAGLEKRQNGDVLATRDITRTTGFLMTVPLRHATMLKYRSTDTHGQPIYGTATVVEPRAPWKGPGPRPILVNNLPINGLGVECTSGYTLTHGWHDKSNQTDLFPPTTQLALARGYAVIVPDHEGPRQAYAEPTLAGHVVLDAIRAAAKFAPQRYARSRVAVTGYSGGAIATDGTAKVIGEYAPDLVPRVVGAALGGVPADFRLLAAAMNRNVATGVMLAGVLGIARENPEILTLANNAGTLLATSTFKNSCGSDYGLAGPFQLPAQILSKDRDPFGSEVAERIYRKTTMPDAASAVPMYIYHGTHEIWIPAQGARNLYAQQCRLGANAVYREVPGEHLSAAVIAYPEAMGWLDARLRGEPAESECRR